MNQSKIVRVAVRITESVIDIIKDEFMNEKPKKKRRERKKRKDGKAENGTDTGGRGSTGSNSGSNL